MGCPTNSSKPSRLAEETSRASSSSVDDNPKNGLPRCKSAVCRNEKSMDSHLSDGKSFTKWIKEREHRGPTPCRDYLIVLSPSYGDKAGVKAAKIARIFYNASVFNTLKIKIYELIHRS